ncbi:MAG: hypothetical protein IPL58_15700 [Betaproteobacteria bacterium]|uniref:Uncharacterized protein n=1 Tax=Candidatus Proximibacter danicus TaxID=2954365 RepID=A0A9D7K414_9PROT|nr:hypothetical protein [Candidatus Proximibacter danicus]
MSRSLPKVTTMTGDDNARRARFSLEYEQADRRLLRPDACQGLLPGFGNTQPRTTSAAPFRATCSAASGAGNDCDIYQDFFFDQTTTGINLQFESLLGGGSISHLLTYGADLMRMASEEHAMPPATTGPPAPSRNRLPATTIRCVISPAARPIPSGALPAG